MDMNNWIITGAVFLAIAAAVAITRRMASGDLKLPDTMNDELEGKTLQLMRIVIVRLAVKGNELIDEEQKSLALIPKGILAHRVETLSDNLIDLIPDSVQGFDLEALKQYLDEVITEEEANLWLESLLTDAQAFIDQYQGGFNESLEKWLEETA